MSYFKSVKYGSKHLYEISFSNKGGLVMPIIVEFTFADGTTQTETVPVQIWRKNENKVTKVFLTKQTATGIRLDPMRVTADIDETNNTWPKITDNTKFAIFKASSNAGRGGGVPGMNPMQAVQKNK